MTAIQEVGLSRRKFCRDAAIAAMGLFLPANWSRIPTENFGRKERLQFPLDCNPIASMTNLSRVPKDFYNHTNQETISCTIGFHWAFGNTKCFRQPFWEGVKKAIKRKKQEVYLTIELPGESDRSLSLDSWENHTATLASIFDGANFIIGNENNLGPDLFNPQEYAEFYLTAQKAIKLNGPSIEVFPYAEAYCGRGDYLTETLREISRKADLPLRKVVQGLPFHFYDTAGKLPSRVGLYRAIAESFGIAPALYLTELGRKESAELSESQLSDLVTQNLATALALKDQGLEVVFWHTAFDIPEVDLGGHSLVGVNNEGQVISLRKAFIRFWQVSQWLYQGVSQKQAGDLTVVKGTDCFGNQSSIIWDSFSPTHSGSETIETSGYLRPSLLSRSNTPGVEGKPVRISSPILG